MSKENLKINLFKAWLCIKPEQATIKLKRDTARVLL